MFSGENREILLSSRIFQIGQGIKGRFLKKKDSLFELAIIIDEDCTAEKLRDAWKRINKLKETLKKHQGSDTNKIQTALVIGYFQMKLSGWSYKAIAMDVNYDCLVNFCRGFQEAQKSGVEIETTEGFQAAFLLMKVMRMKDEECLSWLLEGAQNLEQNICPWALEGGPIDWLRVRDTLRQFKKEVETEKLIIKKLPKTELKNLDEIAKINDPFLELPKKLLDKDYPNQYEKFDKLAMKYLIQESSVQGTGKSRPKKSISKK